MFSFSCFLCFLCFFYPFCTFCSFCVFCAFYAFFCPFYVFCAFCAFCSFYPFCWFFNVFCAFCCFLRFLGVWNLFVKKVLNYPNDLIYYTTIMQLIIYDLGWLVLFYMICRTQICRLSLKINFLQFSIKSMLESAQQINKTDLDYYVTNHQWFRVAYIILCNLQNTNSQILLTKTPLVNPITDY